jgi:hypothetical protein
MEKSAKLVEFDLNDQSQTEKRLCGLYVYICTWNVNTTFPNAKSNNLIKFDTDREPDICIYGYFNLKTFQLFLQININSK